MDPTQIVIGAGAAVLFLGLVWSLSRRSRRRAAEVTPPEIEPPLPAPAASAPARAAVPTVPQQEIVTAPGAVEPADTADARAGFPSTSQDLPAPPRREAPTTPAAELAPVEAQRGADLGARAEQRTEVSVEVDLADVTPPPGAHPTPLVPPPLDTPVPSPTTPEPVVAAPEKSAPIGPSEGARRPDVKAIVREVPSAATKASAEPAPPSTARTPAAPPLSSARAPAAPRVPSRPDIPVAPKVSPSRPGMPAVAPKIAPSRPELQAAKATPSRPGIDAAPKATPSRPELQAAKATPSRPGIDAAPKATPSRPELQAAKATPSRPGIDAAPKATPSRPKMAAVTAKAPAQTPSVPSSTKAAPAAAPARDERDPFEALDHLEAPAPKPEPAPERPSGKVAAAPSPTAELEKADPRHQSARRFARVAVGEIKLYHESEVIDGRQAKDLWKRLGSKIDLCIQTYETRVPSDVRERFDYLYDEILRQLAEGDPAKLGADAPTYTSPKR